VFDLTAYLQKSEVPVRIFRLSSSDWFLERHSSKRNYPRWEKNTSEVSLTNTKSTSSLHFCCFHPWNSVLLKWLAAHLIVFFASGHLPNRTLSPETLLPTFNT
jgi:hypothetical protein